MEELRRPSVNKALHVVLKELDDTATGGGLKYFRRRHSFGLECRCQPEMSIEHKAVVIANSLETMNCLLRRKIAHVRRVRVVPNWEQRRATIVCARYKKRTK